MRQNILKCLVLFVLVFAVQTGFSQKRLSVSVGSGFVVSYGDLKGIGVDNDIVLPVNSYLSCGLNFGYAMFSYKKTHATQTEELNQNSIYFGNLNLYYNPKIYKNLRLIIFGGGGIRHYSLTHIFFNSNFPLYSYNIDIVTGFGFNGGAGFNYEWNNYMIGIKYKFDLYKDGFDYFGLNFGIYLD